MNLIAVEEGSKSDCKCFSCAAVSCRIFRMSRSDIERQPIQVGLCVRISVGVSVMDFDLLEEIMRLTAFG